MQLRELEVRNIRSFEAARLSLGPGTTLIVGDVGAGKSSLLYALEMALFGVAEVDAAYLVRHGTSRAEVAVTLDEQEHRYTVRRRFRRVRRRGRETFEPERLTYTEDGSSSPYSATEIRQRVISLLGFPDNPNPHAHSDLWRWAVYVPQERMREILAAHPEERLETVRKALGVERLRTAAENAVRLASDLKSSARARREEIQRLAHWDTEHAEAAEEADRLRRDRAAVAESAALAERALVEARAAVHEHEASAARIAADRRELEGLLREDAHDTDALSADARRTAALGAEIVSAEGEEKQLSGLLQRREEVARLRTDAESQVAIARDELERTAEESRRASRMLAEVEATKRQVTTAEHHRQQAESDAERAERLVRELEQMPPAHAPPAPTNRSVAALEVEVAQATAAEHAAVLAVGRGEVALAGVQQLLDVGVCPTCHQRVEPGEFGRHREELAQAVELARLERDKAAASRASLDDERKARERFDRAQERWTDLEQRRTAARGDAELRREQLAEARTAESAASSELARAHGEAERLRPVEEARGALQLRLSGAEEALRRAIGEAEQMTRADARSTALHDARKRLEEELRRLTAEVEVLQRRRTQRSARIDGLRATIASATQVTARLEQARAQEQAAERRRGEGQAQLARLDAQLDANVRRLALAERGRAQRATLTAEALDFETKAAWVDPTLRLALLRMEKELLAHAQVTFDRAFSRYFASLVDDPALTARTDAAFTPEVTIGPDVTPAEALSGGERTSLALAFRLALSSVVRQLGDVRLETLLLDEPTDGFSTEQVVRMGELLEELGLPQVIVVSHESQLAGIADRTVRVAKVNGVSSLEDDVSGPSPEAGTEPEETD